MDKRLDDKEVCIDYLKFVIPSVEKYAARGTYYAFKHVLEHIMDDEFDDGNPREERVLYIEV